MNSSFYCCAFGNSAIEFKIVELRLLGLDNALYIKKIFSPLNNAMHVWMFGNQSSPHPLSVSQAAIDFDSSRNSLESLLFIWKSYCSYANVVSLAYEKQLQPRFYSKARPLSIQQ